MMPYGSALGKRNSTCCSQHSRPASPAQAQRLSVTRGDLLEIVLDLGREPDARFTDGEAILDRHQVTHADLEYVVARVAPFGDDNRAGIERTLHRISALRNRSGVIIGLTCRVGRAVDGDDRHHPRHHRSTASRCCCSGAPGIGKTTMLRECARVLADDCGKRVVIVDTSNEIAGDGDVPHPGIGSAAAHAGAHAGRCSTP
jgi:stage III sporulation protein SpoIIIAA